MILLLSLALLIAVPANAGVVQPTDDSSGNGHHLIEDGNDPTPGFSSNMTKYGEGFNFDGNEYLTVEDPAPLDHTGDLSITAAYSTDGGVSHLRNTLIQSHAPGPSYKVKAGSRTIEFSHNTGTNNVDFDCTFDVSHFNVSFHITRTNGALDSTIAIKAFNGTGTIICDESGTIALASGALGEADVFIGDDLSADSGFEGSIYEVRVWLDDLPTATLDDIANPTTGNPREAEGTEEALWFMERFLEPSEATELNYVLVHGPEQADAGTEYTLYAEAHNETGDRVLPTSNPTLFLQRVRMGGVADLTFFWNTTTGSFQTNPHPINMTPATDGGNETLFNATFNLPTEGGPLTANVIMEVEIPPTGEQEEPVPVNFTGDHTLQVSDTVTFELTMSSMTQTQTIEFLFWAIVFAWTFRMGWILPSFGAFTGLLNPVWTSVGVQWPVNFETALLATLAFFMVQGFATGFAWKNWGGKEQEAS